MLAVAVGLASFCGTAAAASEAALAVCLPANDPPRSVQAGAAGLDIDVARLAAARLQRPLRLVWLPEQGQTDIESTDLDFRPLLRGECDAQLSVPGDAAIARFRTRLALTKPYYGAAYELLPANADLRWDGAYAGAAAAKVAVRANTVAHAALDAADIPWTMQRTTADILAALRRGDANAALGLGAGSRRHGGAPQRGFQAAPGAALEPARRHPPRPRLAAGARCSVRRSGHPERDAGPARTPRPAAPGTVRHRPQSRGPAGSAAALAPSTFANRASARKAASAAHRRSASLAAMAALARAAVRYGSTP